MEKILLSFLVLDFLKEEESRICLESLKRHVKIPCKIIYLDNGGRQKYSWSFIENDLCDVLISKKNGNGGGFGQTDLFRYCDTEFAIFLQNDQELIQDITEETNNKFIELLNNGYKCIDLNGDQSRRGAWTDRAHFIDVKFFNSLAPFPNGGPGPFHHLRWNENYLQEIFQKNNYQIAHVGPLYFKDCGKNSIRANPDGSLWEIKPDTKGVKLSNGPVKEKYVFPEFTDEEWNEVLTSQNWPDWKIPQNLIKHSFHVWN